MVQVSATPLVTSSLRYNIAFNMAKATKAASSTAKKATNTVRRCSKYNEFIKSELSKVKKENSDLPHKECFRVAAARWKHSPENPNSLQATSVAAKAPDATA